MIDWRVSVLSVLLAAVAFGQQAGQLPGSADCEGCHETGPRVGPREEGMPPPFNAAALRASPHKDLECRNCHSDLEGKELPHPEKLKPVDCGSCHPDEAGAVRSKACTGGLALGATNWRPPARPATARTTSFAPSTTGSPTSTMEIPRLCGRCHREGTTVSLTRHDSADRIFSATTWTASTAKASSSAGLTVTAVCTSCHTAHFVLPHTDPRSSIAKQNIARTCTQCHAQIETVHRKVIRGELWEKQPHLIPACVDCHEPHKVRRVYYHAGHGRPGLPALPRRPRI